MAGKIKPIQFVELPGADGPSLANGAGTGIPKAV